MCRRAPRWESIDIFRLYALDVAQIHPASHDRDAVTDAMTGHVLAYGEIVGLFGG